MTHCNRRGFLKASAAGFGVAATAAPAAAQLVAPPASNKRIAAIATTYHRYSHADNIITRFMEGYSIVGRSFPPPCKVGSLFIDQVGEIDIGRPLAKRWRIPLAGTIAEALTLGTGKLAVDGVVIVAEHGEYPHNERGQQLYPRREFFEEVVKVFRAGNRSVPVFNDKHLSYSWDNAKWMYDQSRALGFPMMAGSSVPVTWRKPELEPAADTPWERALAVGYGHYEVYGFHTLEALQVMVERRPGGETGVKAVQCLEGRDVWEAAAAGKWDRALLDAALARLPETLRRTGRIEDGDAKAHVFLIEYRDGLQAAAYLSTGFVREFAFAGRVKGKAEPASCWYDLPKPQRDHFSFLTGHVARMITTGKASYPVERTLLTGGMLDSLIKSKFDGHKRIETPELDVRYRV
jgi:hypothetical protein